MFYKYTSLLFIVFFALITAIFGQPKTDAFLLNLLQQNNHPLFKKVMQQPGIYRLQIIYTQVNRDKQNRPSFKNYYFNYDPSVYWNPASTVKMPLAFLSLEKLNEMNINGVNKYTSIQFDSSYTGQKIAYHDSTSQSGFPSIAQYVKKVFLVSDNDAYNRFYQFLGQQTINKKLHEKGYTGARITRQFMGFTENGNRHTNQVRFLNKQGQTIYTQPPAYNPDSFDFSRIVKIGKAHMNSEDSLIKEPFDFTKHNNISLEDYQQMLQSVLFPASVPLRQRFNLTKDDYQFLLRYMSQYPSETNYPKYDTAQYYASNVKFFFSDSSHIMPPYVRVFNKVGWAYGFDSDISYVVDFRNNVEFMLAAVIYVNSDEVVNDGKYDYETIGNPFLYQLGQTIYQYELKRPRTFKPDLERFKIKYEKRDTKDKRHSIKDADN